MLEFNVDAQKVFIFLDRVKVGCGEASQLNDVFRSIYYKKKHGLSHKRGSQPQRRKTPHIITARNYR